MYLTCKIIGDFAVFLVNQTIAVIIQAVTHRLCRHRTGLGKKCINILEVLTSYSAGQKKIHLLLYSVDIVQGLTKCMGIYKYAVSIRNAQLNP